MKFLKITGITLGVIVLLLLVIYFTATGPVVNEPYFESDYFKNSLAEIDSLGKIATPVSGKLSAGFSKVSITPKLNSSADNVGKGEFMKMPLAGFGGRKGAPATGIHDSVFVKAAALKVGEKMVVLAGADLLIMPPNITDSVMVLLKEKGISRDQVYFSASHSHSSVGAWGPGFTGKQFAGENNKNVEKWLVQQVANAVLKAVADLKPAQIATGDFNAENYTRNRLVGDLGTKNDDFSFLVVQQNDGKKAVIGSFSAHSTCMGDKNLEISGDYPGYWQRKMENSGVDLAIFVAGSMGSQTNRGEGEGFEKPRFIGESLADSTLVHTSNLMLSDSVVFNSATLKLNLPEYHFRISTTRNLSSYLTAKLMPYPENTVLQVFRIDNMIWVSTPADFSGEFALQFKNSLAAKGFDANITSFNGSYVGYIIPGRYFYLDEYEPKTMGMFGPAMGDYTFQMINQLAGLATKNQ